MSYTDQDRLFEIQRARVRLIMDIPVLGIPIKDMELVQTTTVKTIATDGRVIYFNPEYIDPICKEAERVRNKEREGQTYKDLVSALNWKLGHISVHIGFGHIADADGRNKLLWDTACDVFADNLLNRFHTYFEENESRDRKKLAKPAHSIHMVRTSYQDKSIEELYCFFRACPEKMPGRDFMDEHNIWEEEIEDLWKCRLDQAYRYWTHGNRLKDSQSDIAFYIQSNIPKISEDQQDAWQMMQVMSGVEFANSYSDLPDEEIASTLHRLVDRSPEDFAIIAARMVTDEDMRQKMLHTPEWLRATMIHKAYIM